MQSIANIKHCPLCNQDLPLGDFGIARSRPDGKNLYCKACLREKVRAGRLRQSEIKAAQAALGLVYPRRIIVRQTPEDKIRTMLKSGDKTWYELKSAVKNEDLLGLITAEMAFERGEITITSNEECERIYSAKVA